jgi:sulfur-carrier protein
MPLVEFTPHLARFFPELASGRFEGATVAEVLRSIEARHPGLCAYLVDEHGALRPHVNVFVGTRAVRDRRRLSDEVPEGERLLVLQALSGG